MELHAPVRGIFFDAGWTLFRPATGDWFINRSLEGVLPRLAELPQERVGAAFAGAMEYLNDNHTLSTEDEELLQFTRFYSMLADSLPELGITDKQVSEAAHEKVFGMDSYIYFDDTASTLEKLRGRYKLGVISDTWPSVERVLAHGGISGFFDTKTYSYSLGVWKPDERMYRDALEKMGIDAGQTVFVDDSEENLDGAVRCGMQAVLINARGHGKHSGRYPQITRLGELTELLEKL